MGIKASFFSVMVFFAFLNGCANVVDATNEGEIKTDPSKRTFGGYWDDKNLRGIVVNNLNDAHDDLRNANISVHVYNGVVLLTGEVPNKSMYELAGTTARNVSRARQVHNELQIGLNSSFGSRSNDSWILVKLKSQMLANKDINSSRVKVFVESGTVYLMGLLTQVQTEKITEVVRNTAGVKKVVRAVEYIED